MSTATQLKMSVNEMLTEIYGERYPGFDPKRLWFTPNKGSDEGWWNYRSDIFGVLCSGICKGPLDVVAALSSKDIMVSISEADQLIKRARALETWGPTGAQWIGWR